MDKLLQRSLSKHQVLFLSWLSYAFAYLGRMNISVVMPLLIITLGISKAELGVAGTAFFWAYAFSQYVNGLWGDKFNSIKLVGLGLLGSSVCNYLASFAYSALWIAFWWGVNGVFQAMLWAPLIKTLSFWFKSSEANSVGMILSTSMIGGYALGWGVLGIIINKHGYKAGFLVPAVALLIYSVIWLLVMNNGGGISLVNLQNAKQNQSHKLLHIIKYFWSSKMISLVPICIGKGIVKEGITLWAPLLFIEFLNVKPDLSVLLILSIPAASLAGIFLSSFIHKMMNHNVYATLLVLFSIVALSIILVPIGSRLANVIGVIMISIASAGIYGANNIIMAIAPLQIVDSEYVASVTGFLNGSAYIGSGLAGVLTGLIADNWGWNAVIIFWVVIVTTILFLLNVIRINPEKNIRSV